MWRPCGPSNRCCTAWIESSQTATIGPLEVTIRFDDSDPSVQAADLVGALAAAAVRARAHALAGLTSRLTGESSRPSGPDVR